MLFGQNAMGLGRLILDHDIPTARALLRMLTDGFKQDIPVASVTNLVIPGPNGTIPARHYRPIEGDGAPLLVFYHGGAMVLGDLDTHDDACRQICREGGQHVLSVDYRLAPEHKAPASVDDAFTAFTWALDHAAELGADSERVAVGGDSAGANLATGLAACPRRGRSAARGAIAVLPGHRLGRPDAVADVVRRRVLSHRGRSAVRRRELPRRRDCRRDRPAGIATAGRRPVGTTACAGADGRFDPLRDEGRQYANALRAAGVAVDYREFGSLIHGFLNFFPVGGGSAAATAESISALRAHLART